MRLLQVPLLAAILAIAATACDRFAVENDRGALLRGNWRSTVDGLMVAYNEDGTYLVSPTDGRAPFAGRYTVEGVGIIILNEEDAETCAGIEGRYTVTVTGATARFYLVDDSCAPRVEHMRAPWRRAA